ncbi:MAG: peptidase M3, partial [Erysipelotrichaceae bacterium]|nr:peptidase M3 [Erysipelotrichaceae bacterium]
MNKEWSLDVLYKGYDDPKFAEDEAELDRLIEEFTAFAADLTGDPKDKLARGIELDRKLTEKASDLFSFASLSQAVNTSDTKAASILGRLSGKMSALAAPRTALVQYIAALDGLQGIIDSDPLLKEHEFYLTNIKNEAKYTLSPEVEKVISLYEISGSSAWSDLQSFLTSTVPVEYEGKTTTLSDIRNLAYDPDPKVRKAAYEAELKSYDRIKEAVAFSLNSIKMEVIRHCQLRGYESPLDETLKNNHMKKKTLD